MNYTIDNLFSLAITPKTTTTKIIMTMCNGKINTNTIPQTEQILKKLLPTVLSTTCYNADNLPFAIEVRNTETGHLFEHILLEYLCQQKLAKGHNTATFSGTTNWNWLRDPKGTFHIRLNCGATDTDIFPLALEQTINLMKLILNSNPPLFSTKKLPNYQGLKNGKKRKQKTI